MKKRVLGWVAAMALLMSMMLLVSACSSDGSKLAAEFDAAKVETAAGQVVDLLNKQDTEALQGMSDHAMQSLMTEVEYQKIYDMMKDWGAFQSNEATQVVGQKDPKSGAEYAVAVVKSKYKSKDVVWTISFDQDMKMAGLYVK